jgi:hypothetical protein
MILGKGLVVCFDAVGCHLGKAHHIRDEYSTDRPVLGGDAISHEIDRFPV